MAWTIDLSHQVSLVTGGATGIGAATCRGYAEAGSNVAVNYYPSERDRAAAKELIKELRDMGVEAEGYECDVTDEAQVVQMIKDIVERFGRIDNLFSNAGIVKAAKMDQMSLADFKAVVDVPVVGTFLVCRECIPYMLKQGAGDIVIMGSGCTFNGGGSSVAYPTGKAALEGLMAQMVNEYAAKGIRTNIIRPMVIDTPMMTARYTEETWNHYVDHMPMKIAGTPEDVANLVVFLSDRVRSRYICGAGVNIDGARILHLAYKGKAEDLEKKKA